MMLQIALSALAFQGSALTSTRRSTVQMSEASNTRRALLAQTVAAFGSLVVAAESASAKAGEGPKQSIFGMALSSDYVVMSSPFEIDTKIGKNKDTLALKETYSSFIKKVDEGELRITTVVPKLVSKKSWALARNQLRSAVGAMRQGMVQTNGGLEENKRAKATALYKKFTRDVEALDYEMSLKDVDAALEAADATGKSISAWKAFVA